MDESQHIELLKSCELFKSLSVEDLKHLYESMSTLHVKTGNVLIKQGEPSDCLYVLLSGRLITVTENGEKRGYVGRGETVGEMGLISQTPRSATVSALRDSMLLKLDQSHFDRLWKKNPSVLFEVSKIITQRLQRVLKSGKDNHHANIVFLGANGYVNVADFFNRFRDVFDARYNYRIVRRTDFDSHLAAEQLSAELQHLESQFDYLFYEIDLKDSVWRKVCLDIADRIVVLAHGREPAIVDEGVKNILSDAHIHPDIKKILVLLYDQKAQPRHTQSWLGSVDFFKHYHVSLSSREDMSRLLRLLNGTAVGLVLGGGGSRVWAQIGAMKYIFDEKIPIDAYVGTSAGAMNSAVLSVARDYQDYVEISEDISRLTSFNEYTIPFASLLSSQSITAVLKKVFGEIRIEDLPKFLCCVAADLVKAREVHITSGPVWLGVRSSISIPGIYPPVSEQGQVLVDGGVVNNLPADVMRDYFEGYGKVIAIDISSFNNDSCNYDYPLELTWGKILRLKYFSKISKINMPSIGDTFLRGLLVASDQRVQANKNLCDIYMRPNLKDFGILDLTKISELRAIGYQEALERLAQWRGILNIES